MFNKDNDDMEIKNHFYDDYENSKTDDSTEYVDNKTIINDNENDSNQNYSENDKYENIYQNRAPYEPIKDSYYKETVKKKKGGFKKVIAACVAVSLFGGIGIGAGYSITNSVISYIDVKNQDDMPEIERTSQEQSSVLSAFDTGSENKLLASSNSSNGAVAVINKAYPSIVNISINISGVTNYLGMRIPYESSGAGSGVIFDEDEEYIYIVTNEHVVNSAKTIAISVTGNESINATVVGTDASNDIAVIKALKSDLSAVGVKYSIAEFGNSDKLNVGESVIAIGNALGSGKSATDGMVSVLNKLVNIDGKQLTVIQTSAPINPGNSGGALVNYDGEVIGINTAKTDTSIAEGMGYAIPSNTVSEIMKKLKEEGTQPKPYIGIMGSDITDELAQLYRLPIGVLVRQIIEGTPAEKCGLMPGDIITAINDKTVMNMNSLQEEISKLDIGQTASLNVIRENKAMTVTITISDANNVSEN